LKSPSSYKAAAALSVRRAIDRDELIQIPQSRVDAQFSAAIAIAVVIFCTYLAVL
jgi:hypothetical protein